MKRNSLPRAIAPGSNLPPTVGQLNVGGCHYRIVLLTQSSTFKPASVESATRAIDPVCRFQVAEAVCAVIKDENDSPALDIDAVHLLTPRELQVATLVAEGRLNKQIADQLHISEWTVATHLRRIFVKLGVDTRAAMVYRCSKIFR